MTFFFFPWTSNWNWVLDILLIHLFLTCHQICFVWLKLNVNSLIHLTSTYWALVADPDPVAGTIDINKTDRASVERVVRGASLSRWLLSTDLAEKHSMKDCSRVKTEAQWVTAWGQYLHSVENEGKVVKDEIHLSY